MSFIRSLKHPAFIIIIITSITFYNINYVHFEWSNNAFDNYDDMMISPPNTLEEEKNVNNDRPSSDRQQLKKVVISTERKEKQQTSSSPLSFYDRIDQKVISSLSKPYIIQNEEEWCIPSSSSSSSEEHKSPIGLLYVKVPKTGSSVIASVLERISRTTIYNKTCSLMYKHNDRFTFSYRNKDKSIMIGSLRDPIKRGISRAYFKSKPNFNFTDERILKALKNSHQQLGVLTKGKGGFQLNYMMLDKIPKYSTNTTNDIPKYRVIQSYVKKVMDDYHYIFLNERLDEGLVVLKYLFNLRTSDLLYLSSKVSGGYYAWPSTNKCIQLTKNKTILSSPTISSFVYSNEWYSKNYGDYLLYSVANKSLDLTIESIGKEEFNQTLHDFLSLRRLVEDKCGPKTIFPCDLNGVFHNESRKNCYWNDIGCGWPCFDQFINHTLNK